MLGLKEKYKAKPKESSEIIKLQTENHKPLHRASYPKSTMQVILERRKYTFVQKKNSLFTFKNPMIRNMMSKQKEFRYFCASVSVLIAAISPRNRREKRSTELNCMGERVTNGGKTREIMRREMHCKGNTLGTEKPTFYFSCFGQISANHPLTLQISDKLCSLQTGERKNAEAEQNSSHGIAVLRFLISPANSPSRRYFLLLRLNYLFGRCM